MPNPVTLAEAASFLGVSKATLRNWDREGKLKARRHPLNSYRVYDVDELRALRDRLPTSETASGEAVPAATVLDLRAVKRLVARLSALLRDVDGGSSILERFDELTKLLFLKLVAERTDEPLFVRRPAETDDALTRRLRDAYRAHALAHAQVIPARFSSLSLSGEALRQAAEALAGVSFVGADFDIKGLAYEEVIANTFDKSDNQQFFTPHPIVQFMVAFLRPHLRGVIGDPACGTAGFLAEVLRAKVAHKKLIGCEIDERLAWVAGMSLLLHGGESFEVATLTEGGTLGRQADAYKGRLDAILTNPPFGSDLGDAALLQGYVLGRGRTSRRRGILFIERCWSLLRRGGVLGIVIDEGVLSLPSAQDVRRFILDRFEILAVVGLPETAFMPYATVNASILFLRKSSDGNRNRRVLFARAENVGRKGNGDDDIVHDETGKARLNSDLPAILDAWSAVQLGDELAPSERVFIADVAAGLDGDASLRLDVRYHDPSRRRSARLLERARRLCTIPEVCEERNETLLPSTDLPGQVILYTGLADIEARTGKAHQVPTPAASIKSAVKRYEPGDVVFARMRPNLRKVAHMAFREGGYVSPECVVLTPRRTADGSPLVAPELLAALLRSDLVYGQVAHLIAGIGRPRLNVTDLRQVKLPVPQAAKQAAILDGLETALRSAEEIGAKIAELQRAQADVRLRAVEAAAEGMVRG